MAFGEIDVERLRHFRSLGFEPTCIFDVGASNGTWSWMVKDVFPEAQFHLFEPLATARAAYRELLESYLSHGLRGELHAVAVGAASGTTTLGVATDGHSSSVHIQHASDYFPEIAPVPIVSIDDVVARGAAAPQLIKIDTQGAELQILEGAVTTLPQVDILLLETWLTRGYGPSTPLIGEVMNWLARHDFFLLDIADCYRDADGVLTAQDFFFVNANTGVEKLRSTRSYVAA